MQAYFSRAPWRAENLGPPQGWPCLSVLAKTRRIATGVALSPRQTSCVLRRLFASSPLVCPSKSMGSGFCRTILAGPPVARRVFASTLRHGHPWVGRPRSFGHSLRARDAFGRSTSCQIGRPGPSRNGPNTHAALRDAPTDFVTSARDRLYAGGPSRTPFFFVCATVSRLAGRRYLAAFWRTRLLFSLTVPGARAGAVLEAALKFMSKQGLRPWTTAPTDLPVLRSCRSGRSYNDP